MVILQSWNKSGMETYGELVSRISSTISSCWKESNTLVIVPDRYDSVHSTKAHERTRRHQNNNNEVKITMDTQRLPSNISLFLKSQKNKENLVNYIFESWKNSLPLTLTDYQTMILCHLDGTSLKIQQQSTTQLDWTCDNEEADSKMFVYVDYIAKTEDLQRIIIHSPDTDVAIIACYHFCSSLNISELWLKAGVGHTKRYIPIHDITNVFGFKLLPPTLDSLILHIQRANYQAYIWKHATKSSLVLPTPIGNG